MGSEMCIRDRGLPKKKVVGMAGILDSSRFIYFLSQELKLPVNKIKSLVLGGHGDSMVAMTNHTFVDGKSLKKLIEDGIIKKLYVTGCLSERYKDDLKTDIPEVDGFYGTRDLPELLKNFEAKYRNELLGDRIITTDSHYAYLKISEGCDRPCSFCAIPLLSLIHI